MSAASRRRRKARTAPAAPETPQVPARTPLGPLRAALLVTLLSMAATSVLAAQNQNGLLAMALLMVSPALMAALACLQPKALRSQPS